MLDMAARRLKEGADPTTVQGEVLAAAATDDQIVATSYDAQGIIGVQLADGQQHLIQIVGAPDAATTEEEAAIFDIDDLGDAEQLSAEIAAQLDELGGPRDIPDDIVAAVNAQRVAARVSGPILTDRAEFVLPKTRYAAIVSTSSGLNEIVPTMLREPGYSVKVAGVGNNGHPALRWIMSSLLAPRDKRPHVMLIFPQQTGVTNWFPKSPREYAPPRREWLRIVDSTPGADEAFRQELEFDGAVDNGWIVPFHVISPNVDSIRRNGAALTPDGVRAIFWAYSYDVNSLRDPLVVMGFSHVLLSDDGIDTFRSAFELFSERGCEFITVSSLPGRAAGRARVATRFFRAATGFNRDVSFGAVNLPAPSPPRVNLSNVEALQLAQAESFDDFIAGVRLTNTLQDLEDQTSAATLSPITLGPSIRRAIVGEDGNITLGGAVPANSDVVSRASSLATAFDNRAWTPIEDCITQANEVFNVFWRCYAVSIPSDSPPIQTLSANSSGDDERTGKWLTMLTWNPTIIRRTTALCLPPAIGEYVIDETLQLEIKAFAGDALVQKNTANNQRIQKGAITSLIWTITVSGCCSKDPQTSIIQMRNRASPTGTIMPADGNNFDIALALDELTDFYDCGSGVFQTVFPALRLRGQFAAENWTMEAINIAADLPDSRYPGIEPGGVGGVSVSLEMAATPSDPPVGINDINE
ncbi:MAG: hypothetical protein R3E58_19180 [Phycisphaerae bacterium]